MDEDHSATLQEMDDSNNKKLMTEYEKYQELQARSLKLQEVTSSLHHLNTCFQTLFIGLGSDVGCTKSTLCVTKLRKAQCSVCTFIHCTYVYKGHMYVCRSTRRG